MGVPAADGVGPACRLADGAAGGGGGDAGGGVKMKMGVDIQPERWYIGDMHSDSIRFNIE